MTPSHSPISRARTLAALVAGVVLLGACGGGAHAPEAGEYVGAVPDLMGRKVMVLPVQLVDGVPEPVDPEIVFALEEHGEGIDWVMPDQVRRAVDRTPGMDVKVDDLPVGIFMRAEVERVGDPLFGYLRRLAALTGAQFAVIPVQVRYRMASDELGSAVEILTTVLDPVSGRIFWTGVIDGDEGPADDVGTLASTANNLARRLAWSSQTSQQP